MKVACNCLRCRARRTRPVLFMVGENIRATWCGQCQGVTITRSNRHGSAQLPRSVVVAGETVHF